jgi:hypothetical protein
MHVDKGIIMLYHQGLVALMRRLTGFMRIALLAAVFCLPDVYVYSLAPKSYTTNRRLEGRMRIRIKLANVQGGMVLLTRLGGYLSLDRAGRLIGPAQALGEDFEIIQTMLYESRRPTWFREFLVLEKGGGHALGAWSEEALAEDRAKMERLIAEHGSLTTEHFMLFPDVARMDYVLYEYAGYYILTPTSYVPFSIGGHPGEVRQPFFVLKDASGQWSQIETALNDIYGYGSLTLTHWELDEEGVKQIRDVLREAPEDAIWIYPLRGFRSPLPSRVWKEKIEQGMYQRDKEMVDAAIIETLALRLLGRSEQELKKLRILDLGAASGILIEQIVARFPGLDPKNIIGLERNEELVRRMRQKGIPAVLGDATDLPFYDGMFDIVIAESLLVMEVMHEAHIPKALREIVRVTRGRGPFEPHVTLDRAQRQIGRLDLLESSL